MLAPASAQTEAGAALPSFEVASVKPTDLNGQILVGIFVYPGGRVVIHGLELKALMAAAFGVSYQQVSGGDRWTESVPYEVEAKPSEAMQATIKDLRCTDFSIDDERLRQMLQALLIDRFQLKFHRETKTGDVRLLERNGKTLGLVPSAVAPTSPDPANDHSSRGSMGYGSGKWGLSNTTMAQLARFASYDMEPGNVLDRTGLSGRFNYSQAAPDDEPAHPGPALIDSFMNMLSTVGLQMEHSKERVETLVIDSVEKPSAN